MTTLKRDKVVKFRERLYQKRIPNLLKAGIDDLKPIKRSKTDQDGNTVIATNEIISFFNNAAQTDTFIDADQYFSDLYTLFNVLTRDSEQYMFNSDVQISVEDINDATNKKAIEYLTTNLIISFFENAHMSDGTENDAFLEKDLKKVIIATNEGRDYRTLVNNTLQTMVKTLQENKPWRESLDDIQTASLVCRLVGAKLPQIDKKVLSKIVLQSRNEVQNYIALFTKILNTRTQLIKEEKNKKTYLKAMAKLDTALTGILQKIDTYLVYAHTFIKAIGASTQGFLGPSDAALKKCIAIFFFNYDENAPGEAVDQTTYSFSTLRYRMTMLLGYPELTRFTRSLKQEKDYKDLFTRLYGVYFDQMIKQIALISRTDKMDTTILESYIGEALRIIDTFKLGVTQMADKKSELKKRYLSLVRLTHHEKLPAIMNLNEWISQVTQDTTMELIEDSRRVLLENCYANLSGLDIGSTSVEELNNVIKKLIMGYAIFYKPQRFFFNKFYKTYVGEVDDSLAPTFSTLIQTKKMLAISLLTLFSDTTQVGQFLSKSQIEYADKLLQSVYNRD